MGGIPQFHAPISEGITHIEVVLIGGSNIQIQEEWGGSSPIFVRGCAISEFETPPFDKARQRQKIDPFVRVGKNDLKKYMIQKTFEKFCRWSQRNMHF